MREGVSQGAADSPLTEQGPGGPRACFMLPYDVSRPGSVDYAPSDRQEPALASGMAAARAEAAPSAEVKRVVPPA